MNSETRNCQNCSNQFEIDSQDFAFYERIKVPLPTFCPRCRFQRRLLSWNALNLYKRKCDLCGEMNISVYPPDAPYRVYCPTCWWSDNWDPLDYGKEYDFSKPFFEQLNELWHEAPLIGLSMDLETLKTSPYNHDSGRLKNCYLMFHTDECEDSVCGYYIWQGKSMFDCFAVIQGQYCYDSMHCYKVNNCVGIRKQISESINCLFCRDCQNCQDCFASANLKNKKYWAWNKPMSKEEYLEELGRYNLGSYQSYKEIQARAKDFWKTQIPKSEYNEFVENCVGSNVFYCKNVKDAIEVYETEDSRYIYRLAGPGNKYCYDVSMWGANLSNSYENCVVGLDSTHMMFCHEGGLGSSDLQYSKLSVSSNHNFACVSIKKSDYVIFNRKYSKEEYLELVEKIKKHMEDMPYVDKVGKIYRYGEFLPPIMSPFAYNTTLAQNFFPLTKEGALARGYFWRESESKDMETTIQSFDLPDHIKDAPDSIPQEKIACAKCGRAYRIIEMELDFHRKKNLALPRECPMCRINTKLDEWARDNGRNPRTCSDCGKSMESPYTEAEESRVYCRECYLARI